MIDTTNLKAMLHFLGFKENDNIFSKNFGDGLYCVLSVDFKNKKLHYPEQLKINDNTTTNFEHPENFVVFECVARLLNKGYRPEHIELEKRWNLGHEAKGGKADICVYDADGKNMLLIIECKTFGTEYSKEKKQTLTDGGQLFSYWQQERSTKWLSLYASDFRNGKIIFENDIINCSDDNNLLELAKKDDSLMIYQKAYSATDKFEVWNETYQKTFYSNLIFGDDSVAYQIGVRPLRKSDLKDFSPDDKIVNRFEEILRHNNVSDKENAFNRLTALFICKLVDEIGKTDEQELEFQYKQGTDTYETLQDRLQKLHQQGMDSFMKEKIFYVANDYAEKLVKQYSGHQRKAMIEDLQKTIRILKFYSNNDFSFKDVHNEELFLQNGKVLVEVVQLFEHYRIVYHNKHQFLGDLFEQLLNKGFKQNEGQFFTPMPITRFIWDALPLDKVVHNAGKYNLPKVIDFACGAGHFLTEAVEAINCCLASNGEGELIKDNAWVEKNIFGVEKDYRLARVSKISLFMNGSGFGNIIFGDGLENYPEKQIEAGSFDILVANPPYSVSAFKAHLKLKNNSFELFDRITNDGSEIEVLFVERIAQLLKPQGIAAVILPASILSNSSNSYIGARENLLENFKIRAIAQFGSKTFGATGTNTIIAFLEKYDEPPKRKEIVEDSVTAIQAGRKLGEWEDQEIFNAYLEKIQVSEMDYRKFLSQNEDVDFWLGHVYFGQYAKAFEALTETRKKKGQNSFKKLSDVEQKKQLRMEFYRFVSAKEADKLKYFALVYQQTTLVVTAPAGNDEQKVFLGYDWSNRKGAEGIQVVNPGGKLYNDSNRMDEHTTASAVRSSFNEQPKNIPELDKYLSWLRLQDMIDFSRLDFNKEIKTAIAKKLEIKSKWPLVKLGEVAKIDWGNTNLTKEIYKNNGTFNVYSATGLDGKSDFYEQEGDAIILSAIGARCGKCFYAMGKWTAIKNTIVIKNIKKETKLEYLFLLLNDEKFWEKSGSAQPFIGIGNAKEQKIPLPPPDIQKQIVAECDKVDAECDKARKEIEEYREKIVQELVVGNYEKLKLKEFCEYSTKRIKYSQINPNSYITTDNLIKNMGGATLYSGIPEIETVVQYVKGDILVSNIRPYLKKIWFADTNGGASPDVLVFHNLNKNLVLSKYLYFLLKCDAFFEWAMQGVSGAKMPRGDKNIIMNYEISCPSLVDQENKLVVLESLEKKIADAQNFLSSAQKQKNDILNKWL